MTAKRFKDPNFRLACLDALLCLGKVRNELSDVLKTPFSDKYSFEIDQPRLSALNRIPIIQDDLDTITDFGPDGGDDIYTYVIPEWRGTQRELYINSFQDLRLLRKLQKIRIFACVEKGAFDLSLLAPLKHLQVVETDYFFVSPECDIDGTVRSLKERGVEVKISGQRK